MEAEHLLDVVPRHDLALVRGGGSTLWDAHDRAYLDLGASHGVNLVGHAHPRVVAAVQEQAERLLHATVAYGNDQRARLLHRLAGMAPGDLTRCFLVNSGAEAVETAIKVARAATARDALVAFRNGFHGRTLGALSVTWRPAYRAPFEPLLPHVRFATFGDPEGAKEAIGRDTAAVVVEPVQGEGGVRLPPPGWLRLLRDLCDDAGALLVADEVQTGLGRTGRPFAVDHEGVVPDILCLAKGLAGGLPMGAVLVSGEHARLPTRSHGSTFGGNPLASAAALATLDVLEDEDLPARAAHLGERFLAGLRALDAPVVRDVRGVGLMAALELRTRSAPFLRALRDRGVLALGSGATIARFLPPLVIEQDELDQALEAVGASLPEVDA